MRGTPRNWKTLAIALRITPAYAGNTAQIGDEVSYDEDHPRVCGEHYC